MEDSSYEELERVFDKFPKYRTNILLRDFNVKAGKTVSKKTIRNESLHEIINDNRVRVVNFATSKNLTVKKKMFPHHNIHNFIWTSQDGKTHNPITLFCLDNHIWLDRKLHPSVFDVRSFRAADCDTDYYLVVAKIRDILAVSKQTTQRFNMESVNLKKLSEVEGKEQYRVEISNRFAVLENLNAEVDINRA
jgi:hypothetical protein